MNTEVVDVWNAVLAKEARSGVASLSPNERTIYFVNRFICDFSNGGLSGFLYNLSPEWASLGSFEEEIRRVGCDSIATVIADVRTVFQKAAALEVQKETWSAYLTRLDPTQTLSILNLKLSGADGELWECLETFTKEMPR
ncbi:MAG TPA: DUF4375 domain-containing protein [Candidatus Didemnitutus sp.]|nr:DUF4375 domain-containing protein [Candidatus Didemnitutus sp.]